MLSIIIPAHNEEQLLGRTLDAIRTAVQSLVRPSEILVVDDASTDGTAAIAREHGARVISVAHRQIAATRNSGAKEAAGDMFIFVDADTVVTPEAVWAAVEAMDKGVVGGGCAVRFEGPLPFWARVFEPFTNPLCRAVRLAGGCFLYCTREAFRAVGGFDETRFAAEEISFCRALARQGRFVMLREYVTTSGRKMRTHSTREYLRLLLRLAVTRGKSLSRREDLDLWYGERRPDPQSRGAANRNEVPSQ